MPSLEVQISELRAEVVGLRASVAQLRAAVERVRVPAVLPDRGLTRREAAAALGLSVWALHRWATRDDGPPFRVFGGKAFYRPEELHAWAEARARPAPEAVADAADLPLLRAIEGG